MLANDRCAFGHVLCFGILAFLWISFLYKKFDERTQIANANVEKISCRTKCVLKIQISPGFRDTIGTKQRTTSLSPSFRWQQKSDTEDIWFTQNAHVECPCLIPNKWSTFGSILRPFLTIVYSNAKIKALEVIPARIRFASKGESVWCSILIILFYKSVF